MSSKKKSKARKVAKKAKEQQGMPDTKMQRLKIDVDDDENSQADEDALLEEAIKLAAAEKEALEAAAAEKEETSKRLAQKHGNGCDHGYVKTEDPRIMVDFANTFMSATGDGCDHGYVTTEDHCIIVDFAKTFTSGFIAAGADANMADRFDAAEKATWEKYYPEVWEDPSKLKLVASHFIAIGTRKVCKGNIENAQFFASLACFFEECIAACFHQTKAMMDAAKMLELARADEHTLVKYLRKSIPCNCLDGKFKQVKSITKIGMCCNPQCHMPDQIVERRTMFTCTRCRDANYCSPECQEAAWPSHKKICDMHVWARAES